MATVEHVVRKWGDRIDHYEPWIEMNTHQFWRGTIDDYVEFCKLAIPIIRRHDPQATIQTAGLAGTTTGTVDPWILALRDGVILGQIDWFPRHCYSSTGSWDARFGLCEGHPLNVGFSVLPRSSSGIE